jgi:hypothetical protein
MHFANCLSRKQTSAIKLAALLALATSPFLIMPASAATSAPINWALGLNAQNSGFGYQTSIANTDAVYNSSPEAPDGRYGAGITYTENDPAASLTYSPNPALSLGGLSSGSLSVGGSGGSGSVSASLATGATHMSASSSYIVKNPILNPPGFTSDANELGANLSDQLTFGGSGTITIGFSLDGSVSLLGIAAAEAMGLAYDPSSYSQNVGLTLAGNNGSIAYLEWGGSAGGAANVTANPTFTDNTTGTAGWANGAGAGVFTGLNYNGFDFTGTLAVTDGEVLNIDLIQSINSNDGANSDFSNTGQLSLSGVSYTSNSGVFLTSVPEPASLMLLVHCHSSK